MRREGGSGREGAVAARGLAAGEAALRRGEPLAALSAWSEALASAEAPALRAELGRRLLATRRRLALRRLAPPLLALGVAAPLAVFGLAGLIERSADARRAEAERALAGARAQLEEGATEPALAALLAVAQDWRGTQAADEAAGLAGRLQGALERAGAAAEAARVARDAGRAAECLAHLDQALAALAPWPRLPLVGDLRRARDEARVARALAEGRQALAEGDRARARAWFAPHAPDSAAARQGLLTTQLAEAAAAGADRLDRGETGRALALLEEANALARRLGQPERDLTPLRAAWREERRLRARARLACAVEALAAGDLLAARAACALPAAEVPADLPDPSSADPSSADPSSADPSSADPSSADSDSADSDSADSDSADSDSADSDSADWASCARLAALGRLAAQGVPAGMCLIPGGLAPRGDVLEPDQLPAELIDLAPFLIDRREVTRGEVQAWLLASGAPWPPGWRAPEGPEQAREPARGLSWHEAAAYAAWAGKRLPSEAEWEAAARLERPAPVAQGDRPWEQDAALLAVAGQERLELAWRDALAHVSSAAGAAWREALSARRAGGPPEGGAPEGPLSAPALTLPGEPGPVLHGAQVLVSPAAGLALLEARRWPWGGFWDPERCHLGGEAPRPAGPVGSSPWGVEDLAGSVAEWTASEYRPYAGPLRSALEGKGRRVVRGGSFRSGPTGVRTGVRAAVAPEVRFDDLGFRCARDLP